MNLEIKGIHCLECATRAEQAVSALAGVKTARVDVGTGKLVVERTEEEPSLQAIRHRVESLGYQLGEVTGPLLSVLEVEEMHCQDEVVALEKKLSPLPGVEGVSADIVSRRLRVKHHPARTSRHELITAIGETGMTARAAGEGSPESRLPSFWARHRMLILTVASGCSALLALLLSLLGHPPGTTIPLYLAAVGVGGYHIARRGFLAARQLTLDMNFLMALAVCGAMLIGEWAEAASITFLFALAHLLESRATDRARHAIRSLMQVAPAQAFVRRDGHERMVPVEEVRLGDILIVKPGAKIPLDGRIVKGSSAINQAPITGESMPVEKHEGDEVFAGTINQQGALEVEVTHLAGDSTLARIIHLVEEAQTQKAPSQRFVDQFAKYYTPTVIAGAILIAAIPPLVAAQPFHTWFYRALVLLVIACPCALVISTPVTIVSGLAAAARRGVLIKGGRFLEGMGTLKAVAFDKTGTLTRGVPVVTDILALGSQFRVHSSQPETTSSLFTVHSSPNDPGPALNSEPSTLNPQQREVLRIAAAIEVRSEHHLGQAILRKARELQVQWPAIEAFLAQTGRGAQARIEGRNYFIGNHRFAEEVGFCSLEVETRLAELERGGKTTVILGTDTEPIGIIAIADQIREEVPRVLQALKTAHVGTLVMLTGDNPSAAQAIAGRLGIDEYFADLLPADKVKQVRELTRRHGNVAMVGDGVNDAPALAAASIGIAMGAAGTDQALETADVALMGDELSQLPFAVRLGQDAGRVITQNISLSLAIKALFLALAIPGFATLWMAVGADMGASLLVVFNGLRLLRTPDARE